MISGRDSWTLHVLVLSCPARRFVAVWNPTVCQTSNTFRRRGRSSRAPRWSRAGFPARPFSCHSSHVPIRFVVHSCPSIVRGSFCRPARGVWKGTSGSDFPVWAWCWAAGAEDCTFVRSASSTEQRSVLIPAHRDSMWGRLANPTLGSITTCRLGCCGGSPAPMVVFDGGAGIWRTPWYAQVRPIRFFVDAI